MLSSLRKLCIYQMLPFIVRGSISLIWNKVPDREFYWSANHEFYSKLAISICKPVWSTDKLFRTLIHCAKMRALLKKTKIFFQATWNPLRKRKVYKTKVVIQNSDIKWYHESCKVTWTIINVKIGGSFSLTNKNNLILALF